MAKKKEYKLKALFVSGKNKKVHYKTDDETLTADDFPGGEAMAQAYVESGHLVELGSMGKADDEGGESTPKEQAEGLITESKELQEGGDLLGALEKLEAAKAVYPAGKKAPKLIEEITELLGGE